MNADINVGEEEERKGEDGAGGADGVGAEIG